MIINNIEILESQLRQIFAGVVWTHKIQEKQADIYLEQYNMMETWKIALSAITTSGICTVIFIDENWLKILTAVISMASLFINSYFKVYDLKSLQQHHKKSAIDLLELREELIAILCDIKSGRYQEDELISKRDIILNKQMNIYKKCLDASDEAVNRANDGLKYKRDNTYCDEEIDSFLPILARKNQK